MSSGPIPTMRDPWSPSIHAVSWHGHDLKECAVCTIQPCYPNQPPCLPMTITCVLSRQ